MDTMEREEVALRRKAIRLTLKGLRPCEILRQLPRSRPWLRKWQHRYAQAGEAGLSSQARCPQRSPQAYDVHTRRVVLRVRRSLQQRPVGLVGARAVQQELRQLHLVRPVPALTTINRWMRAAGLSQPAPPEPEAVYYPQPAPADDSVLHAMDWTARYLRGGQKVFAFHTGDTQTRAVVQTLSTDKTGASLHRHLLEVWQTLGLPHGLQLDNDAACTGGEKTPRRFSTFVRLGLYGGIELIFLPPHEPNRNGGVERLQGLWARSFWDRTHFHSFAAVVRKSPQFTWWYTHTYCPPVLEGLTPAQALRGVERQRLTKKQLRALPQPLPIPAGQLPFIRRVAPDGTIRVLGESWKVGQGLVHQYVWATVITHYQRLEIHHQRSERSTLRLVKVFDYAIPETVYELHPDYQR